MRCSGRYDMNNRTRSRTCFHGTNRPFVAGWYLSNNHTKVLKIVTVVKTMKKRQRNSEHHFKERWSWGFWENFSVLRWYLVVVHMSSQLELTSLAWCSPALIWVSALAVPSQPYLPVQTCGFSLGWAILHLLPLCFISFLTSCLFNLLRIILNSSLVPWALRNSI